MKKAKLLLWALISTLCMFLCTACGSFDASGYVKSVIDNSVSGESAEFVKFTNCSEEEAKATYDESVDNNLNSLLEGVQVSEELKTKYRDFVVALLAKTKYEVGESTKNSDGSYTVEVKAFPLTLAVSDSITEKTTAYITELQEAYASGADVPSDEEITEKTYSIILDCLNDGLNNAEYGEEVASTITVSVENKLYTPNQTQLDAFFTSLIDVQYN